MLKELQKIRSHKDATMCYLVSDILTELIEELGEDRVREIAKEEGIVLYADPLEGWIIYDESEVEEGVREGWIDPSHIL